MRTTDYHEYLKKKYLESGYHIIEDSEKRLDMGIKLPDGTYPQVWIDKIQQCKTHIADANQKLNLFQSKSKGK